MKTRIILLIAFISISFSSCIKDYIGHGDDENDTGFITETNYLYADDLKVAFLEDNLVLLNEEEAFLGEIIAAGQASNEQKMRYEEVNNEIKDTSGSISTLLDYRDLVFKKVGPKPPCPKPRLCGLWLEMIYVTLAPNLKTYQLTVYDANGKTIGHSKGEPGELLGVDGLINYVDFVWINKEYRGEILLKAFGVTDKGVEDVSFIYSNIN